MDNEKRQEVHKKNKELELLFPELENILKPSEFRAIESFNEPKKKMLFIVGCARSGTTLLYQYLAQTNYFFYPTNFLSRFYFAPYIGYKLQQALIDFDYKREIFSSDQVNFNYESKLGKTYGPKAPHEFWYFWNRFFKFEETQKLYQKDLEKVDWQLFLKELHALEFASNKSILMKAMNLSWNLLDLKKRINNVHFLFVKRDVVFNAQSLLKSRLEYFGNYKEWYSFKPPNYKELIQFEPEKQVVEQVLQVNETIENQLKDLGKFEYTVTSYEDFCKNPQSVIDELNSKGVEVKSRSNHSFEHTNKRLITESSFSKLKYHLENRIDY